VRFHALLDRLAQEVFLGRTHLWIWRYLNNALVEKPNVGKEARCFFTLTLRAHSDEAFMHLARLFDTTKGSVSLRTLPKLARSNATMFQEMKGQQVLSQLLPEQEHLIHELEAAAKPVKRRRHTLLAHLDPQAVTNFEGLAKEAMVTVGSLEKLYQGAGEVVNAFSRPYRNSMNAMELVGWEDYKRVVELVERGIAAEHEEFEKRWGPAPKFPEQS